MIACHFFVCHENATFWDNFTKRKPQNLKENSKTFGNSPTKLQGLFSVEKPKIHSIWKIFREIKLQLISLKFCWKMRDEKICLQIHLWNIPWNWFLKCTLLESNTMISRNFLFLVTFSSLTCYFIRKMVWGKTQRHLFCRKYY